MPQKKIKKNRLNKRQVEYLKQFNIFVNAKDDDPFYKEKKEVAQALKELNEKIAEYNPEVDPEVNPEGNQEENPKVEEKKKLTKDEAGVLSGLYLNAINKMNAYSDRIEASINEEKKAEDKAGKKAEGKEKQKKKKIINKFLLRMMSLPDYLVRILRRLIKHLKMIMNIQLMKYMISPVLIQALWLILMK